MSHPADTVPRVIRQLGPDQFQVVVYAGRDPVSGRERRVRRTVRGKPTRAGRPPKEAVDLERRLASEVDAGKHRATDVRFGELLDRWLAHAEPDLSPTTVATYRRYVDGRIRPELGELPLAKVTPARLDRFYDTLRGHQLKPASIRQIHAVIRRALGQGVRWGWVAVNAATMATPPRVQAPDIRPPTADDVSRLLRGVEADDPDFATFLWLAALTGARRGEVCGLRWSDVDLEAGTMTIERAVVIVSGEMTVKDPKTHQKRRVALHGGTVEVLRAQHRRAVAHATECGVALAGDAYVFTNGMTDEPLSPDVVSSRYRRYARRFDIPGRLHDLRHWHATSLLAGGTPVRQVAGRLGHASAKMTLDVYSHFLEVGDRDAAEMAERALT